MTPSTTVPRRRLGPAGPEVPVLSLGSWHTYDRMDFAEAVAMIEHAVAAGVTMFDVGVYGAPGQLPSFTDVLFSAIVRAAGLRREDYLLSTKLWLDDYPERPLAEQLQRALFRLGTDHTELAVLGDIRREDTDLKRLAHDLAELESRGLVGCWGVNNWSAAAIRTIAEHATAAGSPGPQVAQLKYGPCRRSIPDGAPFAALFDQGLSLQASDVMEGGVLLGKGTATRAVGRDPGGVRARIEQAAAGIAELARELEASPAQVCLAFALSHRATSNVLFGVTGISQLQDNLGAVDLLERLGAERLRHLLDPYWVDRDAVDPQGP